MKYKRRLMVTDKRLNRAAVWLSTHRTSIRPLPPKPVTATSPGEGYKEMELSVENIQRNTPFVLQSTNSCLKPPEPAVVPASLPTVGITSWST